MDHQLWITDAVDDLRLAACHKIMGRLINNVLVLWKIGGGGGRAAAWW